MIRTAPGDRFGKLTALERGVAGFMTGAAFVTAAVCWCAWRIR